MKISQIVAGVLAVPMVGIGLVIVYLGFRPGGFDPMQLMRERQLRERQELIKKYTPPPKPDYIVVT